MSIIFIKTQTFLRKCEELGLTEENIRVLIEDELRKDPEKWDMIPGAGGLRKMRLRLEGKGKSGGARVLYVNFLYYRHIILVDVYSKKQQEDITPQQKRMYKIIVKAILKELRGDS